MSNEITSMMWDLRKKYICFGSRSSLLSTETIRTRFEEEMTGVKRFPKSFFNKHCNKVFAKLTFLEGRDKNKLKEVEVRIIESHWL